MSSSCICLRSLRSSAPSGSSSRSTAGSLTSARASATRCCWPPESCDGPALVVAVRAARGRGSARPARGSRSSGPSCAAGRTRRCRRRSGAGTARTTGRRCSRCACTAGRRRCRWPASTTRPSSGSSKPAIMRSEVVLPQPDGPEQREELAARDLDRDVVDRGHVAEPLRDAVEADLDADIRPHSSRHRRVLVVRSGSTLR